jgi:hypothetical protein
MPAGGLRLLEIGEKEVQTTDGHGILKCKVVFHSPHPPAHSCSGCPWHPWSNSSFSVPSLPSIQGGSARRRLPPGNAHHNRTFQPCNLLLHLKQKVAIRLSIRHFTMQ